jgi:transglutaminase-like putative cysteine protease
VTAGARETASPSRPRPLRRRRAALRPVSPGSFGPLLLSLSVVAALSRLMVHPGRAHVLVPLLLGVLIADGVTALAVRLRINVGLAVALGTALSLWGLLVVIDPSLFNPASSHFFHGGGFSRQLGAARTALADDGTPLPALDGVIVIIGAAGGLAAALTRGIWSRRRRRHAGAARPPLSPGLAPTLALFVYTMLVSAQQGRVVAFVSYFVGVLAFVALADRTAAELTTTLRAAGPTAARPPRSRLALGALAGCLLVAGAVLAAGAGFAGMRLTVFHVTDPRPHGGAGAAGPGPGPAEHSLTGIALVDHLLTTELTSSKVVVFRALSPVPTYWQVGTLSSFNGTEWLPTGAGVSNALAGSSAATPSSLGPPALPTPRPARTFTARVAITDFVSRLLPAPPGTTAVGGLAGATAVADQGVLAGAASTPGLTYTVTAPLTENVSTTGAPLARTDPRLAPYLALPAQPAVIDRLAHEAVGAATTPAAQAQALVAWFHSGRFRYTLSPPATNGPDPLVQFLTVTRAGFCQQFAGAYGVLARALGIPTRLVAGFTAGQAGPGGSFTVTGADAHVWPQVYLGPATGWVSVEPTPASGTGSGAAEGVLGTARPGRAPVTTTTAAPTTVPVTTPATTQAGRHHGSRGHTHVAHAHATWWIPVLIGLVLLLLAAGAVWLRRRRRAARVAALRPDEQVVRAWETALGALRRNGLARQPDETPGEYAVRIGATAATVDQPAPGEAAAVAELAGLVELACYTPRPCTPGQADEAQRLAATIVTANRSHRRRPVAPAPLG